jgi:hypothetical protein
LPGLRRTVVRDPLGERLPDSQMTLTMEFRDLVEVEVLDAL